MLGFYIIYVKRNTIKNLKKIWILLQDILSLRVVKQNKTYLVMGKRLNRVLCYNCGKGFNPKEEGFNLNNHLVCADCYNNAKYKTISGGDYNKKR